MNVKERALGVDFGGYTTGTSATAVAETDGTTIAVTVLSDCGFSATRETSDSLAEAVASDVAFFRKLLALGPVAVDIPIDLQGLPFVDGKAIWQMTLRPIDRALRAMPPFAERIGSPTIRFNHMLKAGKFSSRVGRRIFETYPAGSVHRLQVSKLDIVPEAEIKRLRLTRDQIDAAICAITALANHRLGGRALIARLGGDFARKGISEPSLPQGYVLLKAVPRSVCFGTKDANDWLEEAA